MVCISWSPYISVLLDLASPPPYLSIHQVLHILFNSIPSINLANYSPAQSSYVYYRPAVYFYATLKTQRTRAHMPHHPLHAARFAPSYLVICCACKYACSPLMAYVPLT